MIYVRTFIAMAAFILLSIACITGIVRQHKEDKAAEEEKKRRRSPFLR